MYRELISTYQESTSSFPIHIESDIFSNDRMAKKISILSSHFAIITDSNIENIFGDLILNFFKKNNLKASLFSFKAGEENKTRQTKEELENQLFEKQYGRDSCIVGFGGGVTTDVTGYLASTYCRGVPFISIPTSLLAMVDAAIGGKNGVDHPLGKNLIGTIYHPKMILIDPSFLKTLPSSEISNGSVEMIKHGLVFNKEEIRYLLHDANALFSHDLNVMIERIFQSCKIKLSVVQEDEKEGGKRRLLNFGHTVGHAIELLSNYQIPHGEAVALGILAEEYMAIEMGYATETLLNTTKMLFDAFKVPLKLPSECSLERLMKVMALDKKSLKGKPRFVMLKDIGIAMPFDGNYCTPVPDAILIKSINWLNNNWAR